jgi:hypothetical protein
MLYYFINSFSSTKPLTDKSTCSNNIFMIQTKVARRITITDTGACEVVCEVGR